MKETQQEERVNRRPAPCVCGSRDWNVGGKLGAHCINCDRDLKFPVEVEPEAARAAGKEI